jgi:hypothetical protein
MKVKLHLEIRGHIDRSEEVDYIRRQEVADGWYRMFPGKDVRVYYTLESKMNYWSEEETEKSLTSK